MSDHATDRDTMTPAELIDWSWRTTTPLHRDPTNLLIHLFAVPLFVAGHVLVLLGLLRLDLFQIILGVLFVPVSLLWQNFGHALEKDQAPPFSSPRDFVRRIYAEQFCNHWRFIWSGMWWRHYRANS